MKKEEIVALRKPLTQKMFVQKLAAISQSVFPGSSWPSLGTVQHWEIGKRKPDAWGKYLLWLYANKIGVTINIFDPIKSDKEYRTGFEWNRLLNIPRGITIIDPLAFDKKSDEYFNREISKRVFEARSNWCVLEKLGVSK